MRLDGLLPARYLMVWFIALLHVVWATMVYFSPEAVQIRSLTTLRTLFDEDSERISLLLFTTAGCAIIGIHWHGQHRWFALLLLPQQAVLLMGMGDACYWIAKHVPPSSAYSWQYVAADRAAVILAAVVHSIAISRPLERLILRTIQRS
jgi:hypothetical protein